MGDPTKAERSLEVLSISNPESNLIPKAKILRGNLLLRIGKFDEAAALFKEIGKQFQPVKDQLDDIVTKHPNANEYFNELVRTNLETFDAKSFLPPLAMNWIKNSPLTDRGIQVLNEIALCQDTMADNDKKIKKMRLILTGSGKVNAFPTLKAGRARTTQIENRLTQLMKKMFTYQKSLIPSSPQDSPQELENLAALVDALPVSPAEFSAREKEAKESLSKMSQALAILEARADRLQAKIVATRLYIDGAIKAKTGVVTSEVQSAEAELERVQAAIEIHRSAIAEISKMIALAKTSVGVGDENDRKDAGVRARFQSLIKEEIARLKSQGISPEITSRIENLLTRIDAVRQRLSSFEAIIKTLALKKSQEILARIDAEVQEVQQQKGELAALKEESQNVIGGLTLANFAEAKKTFDELIIKSDVGVIDVAWARKEEHRNRVQYLTSERLQQLQYIEDDFKEVFEEEKETSPTESGE